MPYDRVNMQEISLVYVAISVFIKLIQCKNYEHLLYHDLLENYDVLERPVENYADTVDVTLGVIMSQLVDVDEKNQIVIASIGLQFEWNDFNMKWDPDQYGSLANVAIPADLLWKPDVLLYNSVDIKFDTKYFTNINVYSDGSVSWIPPGIVQISCDIKIKWFPFDEQACYFKYGSWTYTREKLNLKFPADPNKTFDRSEFINNGEWVVVETSSRMYEVPHIDNEYYRALYYEFKIRRRTLYYGFNMIVPSIFYSLITILGFALPIECNEKITLEITILVNICFFLQMVLNVTPTTSIDVPLIGIFFSFNIFVVSASVVFQVLVLNLYYRNPATHHSMPPRIRYILLHWLPWLLNMHRPGHDFTRESLKNAKKEYTNGKNRPKSDSLVSDTDNNNMSVFNNNIDVDERIKTCVTKIIEDPEFDDPCFEAMLTFVQKTHKELKFVTQRMKRVDGIEDEKNDWKFASAVIDKLCLYLFSFLIIGGTGMILLSAPQLIV